MRGIIFRLFGLLVAVLFVISLIRFAYGLAKPLTFSELLNALSNINFSFSYTYSTIADFVQFFQNPSIDGIDFIVDLVKSVFNLLSLPVFVVRDLLVALGSVIQFVFRLLGFSF